MVTWRLSRTHRGYVVSKTCFDVSTLGKPTVVLGNRSENVGKAKQMASVTEQLPFSMLLPVRALPLAAFHNAHGPAPQTKTGMKRKGQRAKRPVLDGEWF